MEAPHIWELARPQGPWPSAPGPRHRAPGARRRPRARCPGAPRHWAPAPGPRPRTPGPGPRSRHRICGNSPGPRPRGFPPPGPGPGPPGAGLGPRAWAPAPLGLRAERRNPSHIPWAQCWLLQLFGRRRLVVSLYICKVEPMILRPMITSLVLDARDSSSCPYILRHRLCGNFGPRAGARGRGPGRRARARDHI